jgi:serine/threonine protein kinase
VGEKREPATPQHIGRYEIQRVIGRGSMGVVYQAQDIVLRRTVALKTISFAFAVTDNDRRNFERRFLEEARAAAALSHPGIVVVYDFGSDAEANLMYMALEFLRGKTLEDVVAAGLPLDWHETLKTVGRLADALHHAHQNKVIHRDIKPANIMVLGSGDAKVMDFGIAKVEATQLSMAGQVFGSPAYMSPEQAQGDAIDARTDIFSLGCVLYELLTGRKAFGAKDLPSILLRLAVEEPTPATRLVSGLPEDLDYVVSRALAKKRHDRYPNAKAFAEDIDDVLNGRVPRHAAPRPYPKVKPKGPITQAVKPEVGKPAPAAHVGEQTTVSSGDGIALRLPPGKRLSLAVLDGPQRGKTIPMEKPRLVLGRTGGGADVELNDGEASRTHAVIECHGQRILLRDLGSTNGTFVGESRIIDSALQDRTEFRIGRTRLMLIVADQP